MFKSVVHHSGGAVAELVCFLLDFCDFEPKSAILCLFFFFNPVGGIVEFRPFPFHYIPFCHQIHWEIRNVRLWASF